MGEPHFVETPCNCGDAEDCAMVKYIADVRIAFEVIEGLSKAMDQVVEIVA